MARPGIKHLLSYRKLKVGQVIPRASDASCDMLLISGTVEVSWIKYTTTELTFRAVGHKSSIGINKLTADYCDSRKIITYKFKGDSVVRSTAFNGIVEFRISSVQFLKEFNDYYKNLY